MESTDFKLAVLVSGRGTNLQAIIDHIDRGQLNARVAIIITNNPRAQALERGKKHAIQTAFLDPDRYPDKAEYDRALATKIKEHSVDLICLAGYMRILGKEFVQTFKGGIINIHPSLLPAFPGLNVQQKAIDRGVKFSGCTVHFVDEAVDAGPIILQAAVPVHADDNAETLTQRILEQEHVIYPKAIKMIAENHIKLTDGKIVTLMKQD